MTTNKLRTGIEMTYGVTEIDGELKAGVRMAWAVDRAAGEDRTAKALVTSCRECGVMTPMEDDPELKAAGYALCDDCAAGSTGNSVS